MKVKAQISKRKTTTKKLKLLTLALMLCVLTFMLYVLPAHTHAAADIGQSKISPASPFYFLKVIKENFELKYTDPAQTDLKQLEFTIRRLREVKALISKNEDLIEPTLIKFQQQLKQVTEAGKVKPGTAAKIREDLINNLQVLQEIYDNIKNSRAKRAVRSTIYMMVQRADIGSSVRLSACDFLAKQATASALNKTEEIVWQERAQNCVNLNTVFDKSAHSF